MNFSFGSRAARAARQVASPSPLLSSIPGTKPTCTGTQGARSCREHCDIGGRRRLLDHLVGAEQYRLRNGEPERLRCLEIDDHLQFGWELDWQIARLASF